ncbi:hypothetical protein BJX66DRAFT_328664 [Aspergillus keveii]|uniref:Uncharacterized protein n=1 Tax=Aspergillus keveii TaxID=714993 RepID=A0ABR4FSQ6_9EURO
MGSGAGPEKRARSDRSERSYSISEAAAGPEVPDSASHGSANLGGRAAAAADWVEPGLISTPSNLSVDEQEKSNVAYFGLRDQWFKGPNANAKGAPCVSIGVLDPLITVERHHGKYHITARFHVETTIVDYNAHRKDGHELFFHDICLQYLNSSGDEDLLTEPKSDATGAFTVTRTSSKTVSGDFGVSLSGKPSANISLGISRSRECTIEHTVNTWSVSAHRVFPEPRRRRRRIDVTRYQWFWAANYKEIATLTPDLPYTVKRHVLVKRAVPIDSFPIERLESARRVLHGRAWVEKAESRNATPHELDSARHSLMLKEDEAWAGLLADRQSKKDRRHVPLEQLFEFKFCILIRLKKRYGRLHRALVFSGNRNKAKLLEPTYKERFCIRVYFPPDLPGPLPSDTSLWHYPPRPRDFPSERYLAYLTRFPVQDTYNLRDILAKIKNEYDGNWDELQSKEWVDLVQDETGAQVRDTDLMAQGDEADADADATAEAEAEGEMNVTAEQTADATTAAATSYHNIYSQGAANAPAKKKRTMNIEVHRPGGRY